MGFFTPEQAAALAASTVHVATLAWFDFADAPTGMWNGFGHRAFDGRLYYGAGDMGSIEGLEEARAPVSREVTFTLSGVPDSPADLLARAVAASPAIQGRLATVMIQLFTMTPAPWTLHSLPITIYVGVMQPPRVTREAATATTGARRIVTLPTENVFYARSRPAAGRYTDREQQMRHPGDRFLEHVPGLVHKTIPWPDY